MTLHAALTDEYVQESSMRPMYEQADFVAYRDCFYKDRLQTSGVAYTRKVRRARITQGRWRSALRFGGVHMLSKDSPEKVAARNRVIGSFIYHHGPLRILSMPGLLWQFEREMFRQRDLMGVPTEIYTVENDAPIYQLSVIKMPGKSRGIKQITPHAISTDRIACHYFTSIESFITDPKCPEFDVAWIDLTGYVSFMSLAAIKDFWAKRCRQKLALTSLNGRFRPVRLARTIERAGGLIQWLSSEIAAPIDVHEYGDETTHMVQLIFGK